MKNKNQIVSLLLRVMALLCLLIFLLSCGKRDDRDQLRSQRGEPDEIQTIGKDPFWRELWYYNNLGEGYEFRRTSGCGAAQDVYLYLSFNFVPLPDSTSAAIPASKLPKPSPSNSSPLAPN